MKVLHIICFLVPMFNISHSKSSMFYIPGARVRRRDELRRDTLRRRGVAVEFRRLEVDFRLLLDCFLDTERRRLVDDVRVADRLPDLFRLRPLVAEGSLACFLDTRPTPGA